MNLGKIIFALSMTTQLYGQGVEPPILVQPRPDRVTTRRHVHATDAAAAVDAALASLQMKLHNYQSQQSFIKIGALSVPLSFQPTRIDLDCGVVCPDLGDGVFSVQDTRLTDASFAFNGGFQLRLTFEDGSREIKGIHSSLGDDAMPDFDMNNISLTVQAIPTVVNGGMSLSFVNPKLNAEIHSTGGCNLFGIDICNALLGTDRKIQKGVESAAKDALNSPLVQTAVRQALKQYLTTKGVGNINRAYISGNDLILEF